MTFQEKIDFLKAIEKATKDGDKFFYKRDMDTAIYFQLKAISSALIYQITSDLGEEDEQPTKDSKIESS